jgi:hypothetical protein
MKIDLSHLRPGHRAALAYPAWRLVPIIHNDFYEKLKDWNQLDKLNCREYMIHYHGKPI